MNAHVRLSPDGAVPLPRELRDTRGWTVETDIEVVDTPAGILLRTTPRVAKTRTTAEVLAAIRARANYTGPRYDEADWKDAIDRMFVERDAEERRREGR